MRAYRCGNAVDGLMTLSIGDTVTPPLVVSDNGGGEFLYVCTKLLNISKLMLSVVK